MSAVALEISLDESIEVADTQMGVSDLIEGFALECRECRRIDSHECGYGSR